MFNDALISSKSDHWSTPPDFYGELHREFGFTFDPCPLMASEDGRKVKWTGRVFCNPPYSRIVEFLRTGLYHLAAGDCELLVYLIPARTDTAWFHDYCKKGEIRFLRGRLKFGGSKSSAPFPSMVVVFREWKLEPSPIDIHTATSVNWLLSHRFDRAALPLADRHYNRRKVGSPQFVPPGRCLVLKEETGRALWVTSWPFAEFVRHAWPGAWVNSLFRSEGAGIASSLILEAVAVTRSIWPTPRQGMISFVDPRKVPPVKRRLPPKNQQRHVFEQEGRTEVYGYCYLKAGFGHVGYTKGGLWAWMLLPFNMPAAVQLPILEAA